MKIKVEYNYQINKEIHSFNLKSTQIQELYNLIQATFETLPKQFKLLYLDEEGDQITVSTDHDLENIQEISKNSQIKLSLVETIVNIENNEPSIFEDILIETEPKEDTKMVNEENQQKQANNQQKQEQSDFQQFPFQKIAQSFFNNLGQNFNQSNNSNEDNNDVFPGFAKNFFKNICGGNKGPFGGKKWGSFGGQCGPKWGKCGGFKKGFMEHKKEFIRSVVREELEKMFPGQAQNTQNSNTQQVHHRFTCDGCGVHPIVGARYHCPECSNFDFCEKCEDSVPHPHSFLKIRKDQFEEEVKDEQPQNPSEIQNFFENLIGQVTQIPEVQQLIVDPLNQMKLQGKAARIAELIGGKADEYIEWVKKHEDLDCKEIANLIQLEKGIQVSQQLEGLKIEEEQEKQMNIQQQEPVQNKKKLKQFDQEVYAKAQQLSEIFGESIETYLGVVEFFRNLKVCQIAEIILDDMSILEKFSSYE